MNKTVLSTLGMLLLSTQAQAAPDPSSDRLEQIAERGVLRVCTTGDYRPYSYLRTDGEYEGIDIDMARSLAESIGTSVQWVPTTWKMLMPDFVDKGCDIGVGGISVTLERQRNAWYADSLGTDGKIPLVRCDDVARYRTVEQLNHSEVRVIEPPGGTNEAFVRHYLPDASLALYDDNVTIFQQLVDNHADVMITDASEALYQQQHMPALCAVNPGEPLQYGEKAYLLPRGDMDWKQYVDQWLHLSTATGEYGQIATHWLGANPSP